MRTDITFTSGGLTCEGWFYRPDGATNDRPVVVLCHGMGGVKEFVVAPFAEQFVERGFCAFVFDYRYTGASGGTPRGRIIPTLQHDDIRLAITCALEQEGVDRDKLILWGASYGGAQALFVGATDPRVKAVISVVAGLGPRELLNDRKVWNAIWKQATDAFIAQNATGLNPTVPLVAPPGEACFLPQEHCYDWLMANASRAPNWRNEITLESRLRALEYTPTAFIDAVSPRPLLMFATQSDSLVSPESQKAAFDRALEPKRFELFPGNHFDLYDPGPDRDRAMDIKVEWLGRHGFAP